jgi:hypothetical protein
VKALWLTVISKASIKPQVIDLEKKISELDGKIKESQQFWLRLQSNVVALSEKRAQQMDEIFVGRKRKFSHFKQSHNLTINLKFFQN